MPRRILYQILLRGCAKNDKIFSLVIDCNGKKMLNIKKRHLYNLVNFDNMIIHETTVNYQSGNSF